MSRHTFISIVAAVTLAAFAGAAVPAQAVQVKFRSLNGKEIKLADHQGQAIVMVFSSTESPMAAKSLPALQRLADSYESRDVVFYWVSINSDKEKDKNYVTDAGLIAFARENGLRLTVLRDPDRESFRAFCLDALPSIVIIDRKGEVYKKEVGFDMERSQGFSSLRMSLNQLLNREGK